MTTIRRGTKRFEQALDTARNVKCYSLSNGFIGTDLKEDDPSLIAPPRDWLKRELDRFRFAKLTYNGLGHFQVHVHSNLWYEFEGEGA